MLQFALLCTAFLSLPIHLASAQQVADGAIVPFSTLPACASLCGKLFDVQGACTTPSTATSCFCSDARLQGLLQGPSAVNGVCGPASCSNTADLQSIGNWYSKFCNQKQQTPVSAPKSGSGSGSSSSGTSGGSPSSGNQSWFQSHWKYVVMLVVLFCVITGLWITACLLRRRHLKKKEREIEMRPPIAWGPHQHQAMSGGYNYGDGAAGGNKEARVDVQQVDASYATRGKRESKVMKKQRT